jgi:hypothetical protein
MEDVMLAIVWTAFFAAIFLGWYFYIQARNKERMSLIERDKDVSEIYARPRREIRFRFPWLKIGIIFTGFALGWLIAFGVAEFGIDKREIQEEPLIFGVIFLFTAISIIVAYLVDRPKNKE